MLGYIFIFDAVITWALASLVYKFGLGKIDVKASIFFRLTIVSAFTLLISLIFGNNSIFFNLGRRELIFYITMCIISGISVTLGDILYFAALKRIDSSRAYPLTQLSLVFVYPLAFIFFGEVISPSTLIGGLIILSSLYFLSKKDKVKGDQEISSKENLTDKKVKGKKRKENEKIIDDVIIGVLMALGTAFLWAITIISFNQARILSEDVFFTNFFRVFIATLSIGFYGVVFDKSFFLRFKRENKNKLKYYTYVGIAGSLSLGLADSLFYKAAELNGLVITSTITANTPMVQQILSVILLKEKFRPRFIIAVILIILGNYLILFL
jgi:drug/metabolite transporter (DMT)-like permease